MRSSRSRLNFRIERYGPSTGGMTMARTTGVRAWLITWDWDGDHARHDGPRHVVVNWRRSAKYVADSVERLYAQSEYSGANK